MKTVSYPADYCVGKPSVVCFVIEGRTITGYVSAVIFCQRELYMSPREAHSYCSRLMRYYNGTQEKSMPNNGEKG